MILYTLYISAYISTSKAINMISAYSQRDTNGIVSSQSIGNVLSKPLSSQEVYGPYFSAAEVPMTVRDLISAKTSHQADSLTPENVEDALPSMYRDDTTSRLLVPRYKEMSTKALKAAKVFKIDTNRRIKMLKSTGQKTRTLGIVKFRTRLPTIIRGTPMLTYRGSLGKIYEEKPTTKVVVDNREVIFERSSQYDLKAPFLVEESKVTETSRFEVDGVVDNEPQRKLSTVMIQFGNSVVAQGDMLLEDNTAQEISTEMPNTSSVIRKTQNPRVHKVSEDSETHQFVDGSNNVVPSASTELEMSDDLSTTSAIEKVA